MFTLSTILSSSAQRGDAGNIAAPTPFEIDLRQKFSSLQYSGYSRLVIDLRDHINADGYDFEYYCIAAGIDARRYIKSMHNPALTLDLNRPFDDQWPVELVGKINHPRELKELSLYGLIPKADLGNLAHFADFRL